MELNAMDISAMHGTVKTTTVFRLSQNVGTVIALYVIRVQKVETRLTIVSIEQGMVANCIDVVPPHVWYVSPLRKPRVVEPSAVRVNPSETTQPAFVAPAGQQLHADADSKKGNGITKHPAIQRVTKSGLVEMLHCLVEGAHAGKDDPRCPLEVRRRGCYEGWDIQATVNVRNRLDIARAIINDRDHRLPPSSRPRSRSAPAPTL
jgi:hypothetical protein